MELDLRITVLAQDWEDAQEQIQRAEARIAELEAMGKGVIGGLVEERDEANARAEAAEHRADMTHADAEAMRAHLVLQRGDIAGLCSELGVRESEAAALRAEVARVGAVARIHAKDLGLAHADTYRLESSLSEARALLVRVLSEDEGRQTTGIEVGTWDAIEAFLGANPAPIERHPVRRIPEDQLAPVESSRAATELAVACRWCNRAYCARDACQVMLARRQAKP